MNRNWSKVVIAVCFEVLWVIGMKHADQFWTWFCTVIAIILSFYFLISASEKLPVGTVYAVFVGLGTLGTVVAEIVLFNEPVHWPKLLLIALLLIGVGGLKWITQDKETAKTQAKQED